MHAVLVQVLERVVVTRQGDDTFAQRGMFLKQRTHLPRLVSPLAVIACGMNAHMVADDHPRPRAGSEDRVRPVVLLAARQELRTRRVTVQIEHDYIHIAVHKVEVRLAARVDRVAFGYALVGELVEVVVERRPAERERVTGLVVA